MHIAKQSHIVRSKTLAAARVLAGGTRHTPTAAEILLARRMHHEGCDYLAIHKAIGWPCRAETTRNRFRKLGLKLYRTPRRTKPHYGAEPYLPPAHGPVEFAIYRPKVIA